MMIRERERDKDEEVVSIVRHVCMGAHVRQLVRYDSTGNED
jgi:hypothetical protein